MHPELNVLTNDKIRRASFAQMVFEKLICFAKYLKYFVSATELVSSEKIPTIHLILPLKQRPVNLSKPDPNDPESLIKFKKYYTNEIPTYWELDDMHYIDVILLSKFKHLEKCSNKVRKKAYDLIKKEINEGNGSQTDSSVNSEASTPQSTAISSSNSNDRLSGCYDQISTTPNAPDINDELKKYLLSTDDLVGNEDLFNFWKQQNAVYPVLYTLAPDILVVPARNTTTERLFSSSGHTVNETCNHLLQLKVDNLMFLKKSVAILNKIFGKFEKFDNFDFSNDSATQIGKKTTIREFT